jgi:hypothetical protein
MGSSVTPVILSSDVTALDKQTGAGVTSNYALQDATGLDMACRLIAQMHDGERGVWSYQAFDYINATIFGGELPTPLILWELTPWGGCLGETMRSTPPIVRLHPGLLGGSGDEPPWGISRTLLGRAYALDVLLHESIHVRVNSMGGWGGRGQSSHDNDLWVAEVNRIAPLLVLDIHAGRSKTKRIPIDGPPCPKGKPPTKVVRWTDGTVPFDTVASLSNIVRRHLNLSECYRQPLPFDDVFRRFERCNAPLDATEQGGAE